MHQLPSRTGFPSRLRPPPIRALRRFVSSLSPRRCGQLCHKAGGNTQDLLFSAKPLRSAGITMPRLAFPHLAWLNDFSRCDFYPQGLVHQRRSPCQLSHLAHLPQEQLTPSRCVFSLSTRPTAARSPSQSQSPTPTRFDRKFSELPPKDFPTAAKHFGPIQHLSENPVGSSCTKIFSCEKRQRVSELLVTCETPFSAYHNNWQIWFPKIFD